MFTLSKASSDAPSSTSTRTVSACPRSLAHSNAVLPYPCEHSQVITVQRSIGLDEREHANKYIYTSQYMRMYTHAQTSPMSVNTSKKKKGHTYVWTYMYVYICIYMKTCSYVYLSIYTGVFVCVCVCVCITKPAICICKYMHIYTLCCVVCVCACAREWPQKKSK